MLVLGGQDEQEASLLRASNEPLLMSARRPVRCRAKPYPKCLDFYDLRAVKCDTLGLHPENNTAIGSAAAFTSRFFAGGLHGFGMFNRGGPAEGVNTCLSLFDTDVLLAKKNGQMYSFGISTGVCPEWMRNQWPDSVDRFEPDP